MKDLTERQKEILSFIRDYIRKYRFPPTIREIADCFQISPKSAHDHILALERKNVIAFSKNRSRTIEILGGSGTREEQVRNIPIVGTVAAGNPIFVDENLEGYFKFSEHYLKKSDYFALRVKGDSMTGAGILNGDIAIISKHSEVHNGDIVVALVNEENATLKRFFEEKNRVRLEAENPGYKTRYEQKGNVVILGRLAHVMRFYE
ncbi:MAG: transcriptional repressor LexA [Spirochaetales bacterium]|jgi:repressor LexA|nr:transcriptional repressor LexA [Spirochaetales bacterium]